MTGVGLGLGCRSATRGAKGCLVHARVRLKVRKNRWKQVFFLCFSKSLMTNFPTQGKITAPSGNPALAPSAPVRGEKASTVGSSQPAAKQTAREAAISTRYQWHSSGIVITHVLHPSSVRAYLMPLRLQTQEPLTMRIYMEHIWRQTGSLDQERISNQKSTISGDRVKLS